MTTTGLDDAVAAFLSDLSPSQRLVVHNALLAQVDDVHAGGVYSWDETLCDAAQELCATLEAQWPWDGSVAGTVREAVLMALVVPVHDVDHPAYDEAQAEAAERALTVLAGEFGR